jgi:hypothetical protein
MEGRQQRRKRRKRLSLKFQEVVSQEISAKYHSKCNESDLVRELSMNQRKRSQSEHFQAALSQPPNFHRQPGPSLCSERAEKRSCTSAARVIGEILCRIEIAKSIRSESGIQELLTSISPEILPRNGAKNFMSRVAIHKGGSENGAIIISVLKSVQIPKCHEGWAKHKT